MDNVGPHSIEVLHKMNNNDESIRFNLIKFSGTQKLRAESGWTAFSSRFPHRSMTTIRRFHVAKFTIVDNNLR